MRKRGSPSEIRRLTEPIFEAFDYLWQRMHWWIAIMMVFYCFSGIKILKSDEAAVILRWGRLVGDTPALQEHGPGLLFSFPKPIDQVVRVQVKHVWEVPVDVLMNNTNDFNPITEGYALTGDHNIVHLKVVARYRIREPAEWAFYGPKSEDILRVEVTAAMIRTLGEMEVDRVLSDGRKDLIRIATTRAQAGLDAAHSGLELSSLELTHLAPPDALIEAFDAVQSAFIEAQTKKNNADAFRESLIPQAHAESDAAVQSARGDAESAIDLARGETKAFLALDKEYRANPTVVRERLYRDALDRSINTAREIRWVPPPLGGVYHGFRITIKPDGDLEDPYNLENSGDKSESEKSDNTEMESSPQYPQDNSEEGGGDN